MPALVYSALLRDNRASKDNLNRVISLLSGLRWNEYLLIDSANRGFREDHVDVTNTTNKTMLFNDPLLGVMDSLATFIEIDNYQMYKEKIATIPYQHSPFDYVFDVQVALLDVLALKADLGLRLRKAYQAGDKKALSHIAEQLPLLVKRLDVFSSKLHKQWHRENKPHGFDVQDLRLGGLKERLRVTSQKLNAYLAGSLDSIEELNEEILDYMCQGKDYTFDTRNCEYRLHRISSVNVND